MSSLALYRRYRPETFAEVIGQQHVTDPLQQALRNNRVNHAYLFSGPRGCGKTTSARILARCLNCEQGPTPSPCGECQSCRDLARNGPGSIDVIEIDAASHGGVDDARELREKAFFGPASSRYKIYIVDEAHMVTPAGFNALLKVVEEPPEHLKFIFATTEPEKVIGTIRSRTHHYPFRLVPPGTLRDYLDEVCGREQISVEDAVLPLAVRAGAGSVRDSMSVMDQLLAGAGADGVTYAMATSLLGYTDSALLDDVVDAFAAGDGARAFEIVDRVIEGGHDPRRFVTDLLERLRDLVILAAVPDAVEKTLIDAPGDVVERMQAQASVFGAAELSRAADIVNTGLTEMRGATSPRLQLELICARVLLPATYGDERSVQARLDRLERGAAAAALSAPGAGAPGAGAPGAGAPGPGVGGGAAPAAAGPGAASGGAPGYGASGAGAPGAPAAGAGAAGGPPGAVPAGPPAAAAPGPSGAPDGAAPAEQPAAEPARRPGAWPGGTGPGGGGGAPGGGTGEPARRPGAWPGTAGPPSGGSAASAPADSAPAAPAPAQTSAAPNQPGPPASAPSGPTGSAPAGGSVQGGGDPAQIRQMWPQILEAVKNRRRFTWILLSQNAQVVGFDGKTLQVGFPNAGARDSFANGGSDEVLRQALGDALGVQWQVEAIVDPSGGGGGAGGPSGPGSGYGAGSGTTGGGGAGTRSAMAAPAPAPAPPQQWSAAPPASGAAASGPAASAPAPGGPGHSSAVSTAESGAVPPQASAPAPEAPRAASAPSGYAPEEDMPAEDDPDLDESALSGHDLIVRELGATVLEELRHD
ncbi:DNA polymerase III subunit gamma/tau [Streptomyces qinglanensis]|uniref:DNA polymerase III subunit gamma/tau n=1 Tax=Streptomyces qinglanensis TaxID=943816 RepID=A0A1E7KDH9_9ACTN|nr:DNA polymerase III subunit gamma and tau [Streptomyces qinglanensis]OEV01924.1 DNA polymerase III subunit gamma/tau [Streptomyces qinglanensis]